jgi:hypothetical protein
MARTKLVETTTRKVKLGGKVIAKITDKTYKIDD